MKAFESGLSSDSEHLEFRFDLTYADLLSVHKYLRKRRPDGRLITRTRPVFLWMYPALLAGYGVYAFATGQFKVVEQDVGVPIAQDAERPTFFQHNAALLVIASVIVVWVMYIRRRNRKPLEADPGLKNLHCVLTRQSALFGSEKIAGGVRWDGFVRVVLTKDYLYFFFDATQANILPLRAVGERLPQTLNFIRAWFPGRLIDEDGKLVTA